MDNESDWKHHVQPKNSKILLWRPVDVWKVFQFKHCFLHQRCNEAFVLL